MHHHRFHFHFGRHHGGGRGMGRFGKGFMDGDELGGRAFGFGRKLASADLQLLILVLLADKPRHGYEVIKALDERSKGFYVPSPGMVYPALTNLEEIGHAHIEADGTRKLYHITQSGRDFLAENQTRADALLAQFERVGERMDQVRRAMKSAGSGDEADIERGGRGSAKFKRAIHDLRAALDDKRDSSPDEQERIIEVLQRAAADILGKAAN